MRFYGQPVAAVVADDEDTAQSAIEKIAVAYEPLPFVVDPALAAQNGAPLVQPYPQGVAIRTFGVQFADVEVDLDTGEVALLRHVAVHDCGRVISPRQAQSQVAGGITQGIGYALTEELVIDPQTGIVLNPNLEDYLIPAIADIPPIDGRLLDITDQIDNSIELLSPLRRDFACCLTPNSKPSNPRRKLVSGIAVLVLSWTFPMLAQGRNPLRCQGR